MAPDTLTWAGAALLLMGLSAFLSAAETALFSLNTTHHSRLRRENPVLGRKVLSLLQQSTRLLGAVILGNVLANTLFFTIVARLLRPWLHGEDVILRVAAVYLPLLVMLVFTEVIPKLATLRAPFRLSQLVAYPMSWIMTVLGPVSGVLTAFLPKERSTSSISMKELEHLVEDTEKEGVLEQGESSMIRGLLRFGYLTLEDVMIPRPSMSLLRVNASREEILGAFRRSGLSKLPVYTQVPDDTHGLVHLRDVVGKPEATLQMLLRPMRAFPAQARLDHVFRQMRQDHVSSALVIDEHGGLSGLVTYKDLLEEIVGEFNEDYGGVAAQVVWTGGSSCRVPGHMSLRDFEAQTGQSMDGQGYLTVGGAILAALGHMPRKNETLSLGSLSIGIDEVQRRRLEWVHVSWGDSRVLES